jgi:hypothetical protein
VSCSKTGLAANGVENKKQTCGDISEVCHIATNVGGQCNYEHSGSGGMHNIDGTIFVDRAMSDEEDSGAAVIRTNETVGVEISGWYPKKSLINEYWKGTTNFQPFPSGDDIKFSIWDFGSCCYFYRSLHNVVMIGL